MTMFKYTVQSRLVGHRISGKLYIGTALAAIWLLTFMITSRNKGAARLHRPMWRKSNVTGGFPRQRFRNTELWCFLWYKPVQAAEETFALSPIWSHMTLVGRRCNVFINSLFFYTDRKWIHLQKRLDICLLQYQSIYAVSSVNFDNTFLVYDMLSASKYMDMEAVSVNGDIQNNAWVTVNNDFSSRVKIIGKSQHEWPKNRYSR